MTIILTDPTVPSAQDAALAKAAAELNARNTELAPLKKRGGKIVQYSGWADQQVNPLPGIEYYETVSKRMGEAATRDFYRLFMVPGMFHCNGGPGCNTADWLAAAMDWVEKGAAPAQLIGCDRRIEYILSRAAARQIVRRFCQTL